MEMFDCSHMTIRRDIALLEQEGRTYSVTGGVRIASQLHSEPSHQLKAVVELPQKQAMAKLAARLLHPDMTIYLDAGTSTLEIVPFIKVLRHDRGDQRLRHCPGVDGCAPCHRHSYRRTAGPFQSLMRRRFGGLAVWRWPRCARSSPISPSYRPVRGIFVAASQRLRR